MTLEQPQEMKQDAQQETESFDPMGRLMIFNGCHVGYINEVRPTNINGEAALIINTGLKIYRQDVKMEAMCICGQLLEFANQTTCEKCNLKWQAGSVIAPVME